MMLSSKFVSILVFPLICVISFEPMVKNANNYGAFTLAFEHYGDCKGPKSKNLAIMTTELNHESSEAFVNFTFMADAKIDELKIQLHTIKDNKKNFLWNYKFSDPCKHYAFASLIKRHLNADNCFVKKGTYTNEINFAEVTTSFLGTSFFYGTYLFKADLTSKKGNIACFNTTATFKKKQ